MFLEDRPVDQVGPEREIAEPDPRRVLESVCQRRRDRVDRALTHTLGAERTGAVVGVGEVDLGARDPQKPGYGNCETAD